MVGLADPEYYPAPARIDRLRIDLHVCQGTDQHH
jgi:hypothetical protein